jgi:hypothetical protein
MLLCATSQRSDVGEESVEYNVETFGSVDITYSAVIPNAHSIGGDLEPRFLSN